MSQRDQYNPDYLKLYPELADRPEILAVLQQSDRKMKYLEVDIKTERFIQDQEEQLAKFLSSREDSVERLQAEEHRQFAGDSDTEDMAIRRERVQKLYDAIDRLEPAEQELIRKLYFSGLTEREAGEEIGISQKGVNKRRAKILAKLYKLLREDEKI